MNTAQDLKNGTSTAAERCEQWMLNHIDHEKLLHKEISDPISYYKWPLALVSRGRLEDANNLLQWINENCLEDNGDYVSKRSGFHKEFHTYSTLWIVIAAIKLKETALVAKLMGFILKYHNEKTGGLATFPSDSKSATEDPVSTAFLGMVACEMKDQSLANQVIRYFEKLYALQTDSDEFWLRLNSQGKLVKSYDADSDPKTYRIKLGAEDECYYFIGAACYFMARYMETFDEKPLILAQRYAAILDRAGAKALNTIWAAKAAPGCIALYSVTLDDYFLDLAQPVVKAVIGGQSGDGYWIKNGSPWVTVSAEQCHWLTDISSRL